MATNHRGQPIHAGKRTNDEARMPKGRSSLFRVSEALAQHLTNSLEEVKSDMEDGYGYGDSPEEEFAMKHSIPSYSRSGSSGVSAGYFTRSDASQMLQGYRKARNRGEDVGLAKEDIKDALAERDY